MGIYFTNLCGWSYIMWYWHHDFTGNRYDWIINKKATLFRVAFFSIAVHVLNIERSCNNDLKSSLDVERCFLLLLEKLPLLR